MRRNRSVSFAALVGCATLLSSVAAHAQENEVSPKGKGIVGGTLLGAEVVMLTEAAIGAKPWWAYMVGGVAGGAGGGVGGYFAEQGSDAKVPLYMLAGGMALAIPTTVAVLAQTAYEPPTDYTQDTPPTDEPAAEPPLPEEGTEGTGTNPEVGQVPPLRYESIVVPSRPIPPSLVGLRKGALTLAVPAVEVRDLFTQREIYELGVKQGTEVRVPVFQASF